MATYYDLANQRMPMLGDLVSGIRARREKERHDLPGARPADATGGPVSVSIDGESPFQAQPVSGGPTVEVGTPQIGPRVSVGNPVMSMTTDPVRIPDPRAAQVRQLMAQGLSYEQAMNQIRGGV